MDFISQFNTLKTNYLNVLSRGQAVGKAEDATKTMAKLFADTMPVREKAIAFFSEKGVPNRKDERWKYTSLQFLKDENFKISNLIESLSSAEPTQQVEARAEFELKKYLKDEFISLVFINGKLSDQYSQLAELKKVATWQPLTNQDYPLAWADAFDALNAAYALDAYAIHIKPETALAKPIQVVYLSSQTDGETVVHFSRVKVVLGKRSKATLIESFVGEHDAKSLSINRTWVELAEASRLTYLRLHLEGEATRNLGSVQFVQAKQSHLHSLVLALGGALSRVESITELQGEEASSVIDGVYFAKNSQRMDLQSMIDHQVGACQSSQTYKGVLADQSRVVFNGVVRIRQDAQKANSEQLNKNLLLSSQAEIDSKPQLEVLADDVKAAHGSTVGQLNPDEVFYLQSRGIKRERAIEMLSRGYLTDLVYKLEDERTKAYGLSLLEDYFKNVNFGEKLV